MAAHRGGDDEDGEQEEEAGGADEGAHASTRQLGWVAGCPPVFGGAGEDVEGEAVVADDEEAVSLRAGEEVAGFAGGESERLGDLVDCLWGLAEKDVAGGVGDDRLAEVGAEEVGGVLGDRGEAAPAFTRRFGEAVEEGGAGGFAHQEPGFVDEDAALPRLALERAPDRVEAEQQRDRLEPVRESAQGEADELAGRLDARRGAEELGEGAGRVGAEPLRKLSSVLAVRASAAARSRSSGVRSGRVA